MKISQFPKLFIFYKTKYLQITFSYFLINKCNSGYKIQMSDNMIHLKIAPIVY